MYWDHDKSVRLGEVSVSKGSTVFEILIFHIFNEFGNEIFAKAAVFIG